MRDHVLCALPALWRCTPSAYQLPASNHGGGEMKQVFYTALPKDFKLSQMMIIRAGRTKQDAINLFLESNKSCFWEECQHDWTIKKIYIEVSK
jgi:hypothetical protein